MEKESRFTELIRQQQESGLTIKDFCFNQGIATSTFHYWRKKLRPSSPGNGFIPIVVKSTERALFTRHNQGSGQTHNHQGTDQDKVLLELVYPNGTQMRIRQDLDLAHLRALVRLFD